MNLIKTYIFKVNFLTLTRIINVCLSFLVNFCLAQTQVNIVQNPSFENLKSCPSHLVSVYRPFFEDFIVNWTNPTDATPDVYNSCANSYSGVGVPDNENGIQYPKEGKGYVGIVAWYGPWREYIQTTISLQSGVEYFVQFWVALSSNSAWGIKNLGAHISTTILSRNDYKSIFIIPTYYHPEYISKLGYWTPISFKYKAESSGTHYLTIGNFFSSNKIQTENPTGEDMAYYYIDDVKMYPVGCCPEDMVYENTENLPAFTNVIKNIKAGFDAGISDIEGDVKVKSGQSVSFKAGSTIELLPGFSVDGGNFSAEIEDCNIANAPAGSISYQIPTPVDKCATPDLYFSASGATHYYIGYVRGETSNYTAFINQSGPILNNNITFWRIKNVASAYYLIDVKFYNCDNNKKIDEIKKVFISSGTNCRFAKLKFDTTNTDSILISDTIIYSPDSFNHFQDHNQESDNMITFTESSKNEFFIYPNPCDEYLNIFDPLNRNAIAVKIFSVLGLEIMNFKFVDAKIKGVNQFQLDMSNIVSGVYIYQIYISGQFTQKGIIIKN